MHALLLEDFSYEIMMTIRHFSSYGYYTEFQFKLVGFNTNDFTLVQDHWNVSLKEVQITLFCLKELSPQRTKMAVHRVINEDDLQRWQSEMDQYVNDKWKTIVPGVSYYFQLVRCSYAPSGVCINDD